MDLFRRSFGASRSSRLIELNSQGLDNGDASSSFGIGHRIMGHYGPNGQVRADTGSRHVSTYCSVSMVTGMLWHAS